MKKTRVGTDKEILESILTEAKVQYTSTVDSVTVEDGYVGFTSVFDFGDEGQLTRVAAWE